MGSYIPGTRQEQQEMLREIGYVSLEEMSPHIPGEVMLEGGVNTPSELSKQAIKVRMENTAGKNVVFRHILRGVGAYNHYIPVIVSNVTSKEEFVTTYTSYQAEIGQGIPQSILEYQTMLRELTGIGASNASIYDGATAAAEAVVMCKERKKTTAYISTVANPSVIGVMETYCSGSSTKAVMAPEKDGVTGGAALEEMLKAGPQAAYFYVQWPNCYGNIEGGNALGRITHEAGTKCIMGCDLMALAAMKTPAEYGVDTAVDDGQPLGMPLVFGGPYLGSTTATVVMARESPGRTADEIVDREGRRVLVLILQARKQHIRREKVSSNVYSNQAWCALIVSIYVAIMGVDGMAKVAGQCMFKVRYLRNVLRGARFEPKHNCESFHKFVTVSPEDGCTDNTHILRVLGSKGILGGLPFSGRETLWCTTEMNTREGMDELTSVVREAFHRECGQKEVRGS